MCAVCAYPSQGVRMGGSADSVCLDGRSPTDVYCACTVRTCCPYTLRIQCMTANVTKVRICTQLWNMALWGGSYIQWIIIHFEWFGRMFWDTAVSSLFLTAINLISISMQTRCTNWILALKKKKSGKTTFLPFPGALICADTLRC